VSSEDSGSAGREFSQRIVSAGGGADVASEAAGNAESEFGPPTASVGGGAAMVCGAASNIEREFSGGVGVLSADATQTNAIEVVGAGCSGGNISDIGASTATADGTAGGAEIVSCSGTTKSAPHAASAAATADTTCGPRTACVVALR
jgi:hypothetical protein